MFAQGSAKFDLGIYTLIHKNSVNAATAVLPTMTSLQSFKLQVFNSVLALACRNELAGVFVSEISPGFTHGPKYP